MLIVNKQTLETMQPHELAAITPHVMWDFSDDGLVGSDYAIVQMPNQPMFDSRYQRVECGDVHEEGDLYSSEWVLHPVDLPIQDLAALKIEEISKAAETAITSGFYSGALGSSNFYACDIPAQLNIQANLLGASVGRTDIRHICTDMNGHREIREHTALQMIAVGESMGLHIWAQLEKANDLRTEIASAVADNDVDALIAISWA